MPVEATCADCGDVHPVGDRRLDGVATECPACGSTRYTSTSTDDPIQKSENERIADAVGDVHGVGDRNLGFIQARFSTLAELEAADERALREIEGVGRQTAERIVDALR